MKEIRFLDTAIVSICQARESSTELDFRHCTVRNTGAIAGSGPTRTEELSAKFSYPHLDT